MAKMRNLFLTSLMLGSLSVMLTNALSEVPSTTTTARPWPTLTGSTTMPSAPPQPTEALTTARNATDGTPSHTAPIIPTSPWTSGPFPSVSWPVVGAGPPHWRPTWPTVVDGGDDSHKKPAAQIPEWVFHIPKNIIPMRIAHAVLASCAFLVFFPFGGVMIRIWDPRFERYYSVVWAHALVQGVGYILFTAAAGMGIYMAKHLHALGGYHPVIGLCVFALMALQPISELLNHCLFDRYPRIRYVGHVHVWLGRLLLTVGIVNGGLGFHFADSIPGPRWPQWPKIAYGILATLIWIVYVAIIIVWSKFNMVEAPAEVRDEEAEPRAAASDEANPVAEVNATADLGINAIAEEKSTQAAQESEQKAKQEDEPRSSEDNTVIFVRRSMKI